MCDIFAGLGTAIATAWSTGVASSGILGGISGVMGTTLATVGSTAITVGSALSATAAAASAAISLGTMYSSSRASAKAQKEQEKALQALIDAESETGTVGTSKTTTSLKDNSRASRTLSSLRISMLPQASTDAEATANVYGVDSNLAVSSTQNMTGLNIAAA